MLEIFDATDILLPFIPWVLIKAFYLKAPLKVIDLLKHQQTRLWSNQSICGLTSIRTLLRDRRSLSSRSTSTNFLKVRPYRLAGLPWRVAPVLSDSIDPHIIARRQSPPTYGRVRPDNFNSALSPQVPTFFGPFVLIFSNFFPPPPLLFRSFSYFLTTIIFSYVFFVFHPALGRTKFFSSIICRSLLGGIVGKCRLEDRFFNEFFPLYSRLRR